MLRKIYLSITILFILGVIVPWSYYSYQMNRNYEVPATELFIEPGLGVKQISAELEITGFIHNDFIFRVYVWQKDLENKFYAGHYHLPKNLSMADLIEILTGNNSSIPSRRVTIIEGWDIQETAEKISTELGLDKNDFYKLVGYPMGHLNNQDGKTEYTYDISNYSFLNDKPGEYGLEGYLFPDTYEFSLEASPTDVLKKMFDNLENKFTEQMIADAKKQDRTIYEVITIASILEKELRSYEEKRLGAGLINNRLEIGLALQMDSTINYITGKNLPQAALNDLQVDSPYNTYKYKGLPPGPIASPGIDSIMAAIYPIENDYLYFLTDQEGQAHFSKTYEEHLTKKQKYLD